LHRISRPHSKLRIGKSKWHDDTTSARDGECACDF